MNKSSNWYFIDNQWVHYEFPYLNGIFLSPLERYIFENKNFKILYK